MNNKLIRTLIIINGILIPIFILTILGILLTEFITTRPGWHTTVSNDNEPEYVIKYSSPREITNSENNYVAKYRIEKIEELLGENEIKLGDIPENTTNIVFLDKDFKKIGTLLEKDASIKHLNMPNQFSNYDAIRKMTKNITYLIAFEDSNKNGEIDSYDDHYLCISDLNGKNFNKILDKRIKEYKFTSNFTKILITYFDNEKDLAVGIYDIEEKVFEKKTTLNFEN